MKELNVIIICIVGTLMFTECSTESYDFEPSSVKTMAKRKALMAEPSYFDLYKIESGETNKSVPYDYFSLNINVRWNEGYVRSPFTTGLPQVTCSIDSIKKYAGEQNIKRNVKWELHKNIFMPGDNIMRFDYSIQAFTGVNREDTVIYLTEVYNDCIEIPVTIEKQYLREQ